MSIIGWVILGALAGWIASLIMGTDRQQGCIANIVVGIVGALIGGFVVGLLTGTDFTTRFDITSLIVAVIGAIILLAIWRAVRGGRTV